MIPRRRLHGLLLIATLMVPGAALPDAPDETGAAESAAGQRTAPSDSADASGDEEVAPAPADTPENEQADTTGGERSDREPDDVFVPTEKVSEDLSVAFPVDI
jgi:hypothetical protein